MELETLLLMNSTKLFIREKSIRSSVTLSGPETNFVIFAKTMYQKEAIHACCYSILIRVQGSPA